MAHFGGGGGGIWGEQPSSSRDDAVAKYPAAAVAVLVYRNIRQL